MKRVDLDYGDTQMPVELPESSYVLRYKESYDDPPAVDPYEETRKALERPLGFEPLRKLSGPQKRIVIGFPDRVKGGFHKESHRRVAIPLIIEELLAGGAKLENITLLCAMGLHRQNTVEEWYRYLGKEIVDRFYPDRLLNHDAEDSNMVMELGTDEMGNIIQCNRLLAEADIPIILGHCAGNPYGGFSGGYKMLVTGHTGPRSIASHHKPGTMHKDDWLGASTSSTMRKQFESIGKAVEQRMGKKVFAVDAVIGQKAQILQVAAGAIEEVENATWPLASERTNVAIDMPKPADVLVIGLPRTFHYGPGMGTNPILSGLAIAGQLSRCWHALTNDPVVLVTSVCDGWFNPHWFPSYEETYNALTRYMDAETFLASHEAHDIASNFEYRWLYSNRYAYHPFHAMSMTSGYGILKKRTKGIVMVGAEAPEFARGMGYIPVESFSDGVKMVERLAGKDPQMLCTPECFSGGLPVHLQLAGER